MPTNNKKNPAEHPKPEPPARQSRVPTEAAPIPLPSETVTADGKCKEALQRALADLQQDECEVALRDKLGALKKGLYPDLQDYLRHGVERGAYDPLAAYACAVSAGWAYSKPHTLGEVMEYIGFKPFVGPEFKGSLAHKTVQNDGLLVKTSVTFLQSGDVGILCFRGTEPTNVLEWLSNMSFEMDRVSASGSVHSGFNRGLRVVMPAITGWLDAALRGDAAPRMSVIPPGGNGHTFVESMVSAITPDLEKKYVWLGEIKAHFAESDVRPLPEEKPPWLGKLKALYITGHSLGAALAALAAATIFLEPAYACIRDKVYGVYTFGQPLVGDKVFCDTCEKLFGNIVFRHVYGGDVVTTLPPTLYGDFYTFGREYVSTPDGWTLKEQTPEQRVRRAGTLSGSVIPAVLAWYLHKIPFFRLPTGTSHGGPLKDAALTYIRERLVPRVNIADHEPYNYIQCSQVSVPFYT